MKSGGFQASAKDFFFFSMCPEFRTGSNVNFSIPSMQWVLETRDGHLEELWLNIQVKMGGEGSKP